jgi:outer membrane receptor for ferrienterochelin and colicins
MKILLTLSLCCLVTTLSIAQNARIKGEVSAEGRPLELATVGIPSLQVGVISNEAGFFELDNLLAGNYTLEVRSIGYQTLRQELILKANTELELNLVLRPDWLGLEQVVVTATRNEVPVYKAPVIVSRISNRTFETTQILSLSEGLNFSPGLRIENNCQNCGFTQVRMNGLDGPYTQILINSRPVFSALAGVYGLDMLPANMIDRVEVVRGGGSALYGGSAIAGTINIITRDPVVNRMEAGLNYGFTNLEAPDRTLTLHGSVVNEALTRGASFYAFNRDRQPWDANNDGFSEMTLMQNNTFGFDAFWNPDSRSKIRLNAFSIREYRRGGNAFERPPHQADVAEQLDHRILGAGLSYERVSADLKHRWSVYGSAQQVWRDSYYGAGGRILMPGDSLTAEDLLAINAYGASSDQSLVGGLQYSVDLAEAWLLTAGTEGQHNAVTDRMPGYGRRIDQQVSVWGSYAQLEYQPIDRLSVLMGGRFDYLRIRGEYLLGAEGFGEEKLLPVLVPRLTLLYAARENLKLRAAFAQGYRGPQAFDEDLHIETVGGAARFTRLDPALEMERSNGFTASVNYSGMLGGVHSNLVLEAFHTRLLNPFITSDPVELPSGVAVLTKRNGSGARVQGFNAEANLAFSARLRAQTGFTLQSARYDKPELIWQSEEVGGEAVFTSNLLRTPWAYGYFTAEHLLWKALRVSLSGVYTGRMEVPHVIDPDTEFTRIERTPRFFELNTRISYEFRPADSYQIQVFGGVQNLFNSYQRDFDLGPERDASYVYGPARPRTLFVGAKFVL